MKGISRLIATVFYVGYLPVAPGTFGSLAAAIFVWLFKPDVILFVILIMIGFSIGTICAHQAEKDFGVKDSGRIVIDEFIGYLASVAFLPVSAGYVISAFFIFRFFDILKPPPIRQCESIFKGGLGVMTDDLLAGVFTNIILQTWRLI